MRMTRQILIQMAIFAVIATTALAIMVLGGYMRLPDLLGIGQYRVTVELPETGGLYPPRGQCHLSRRRGRRGEERQSDRHRYRGGAVTELRRRDSRRPRRRSAQRVLGRRAVRPTAAPPQRRGSGVEGRRRDPVGSHHGSDRYQLGPGPDQPWPGGDPAREPEHRHRRGLYRGRRARAGIAPTGHRKHHPGDRRPQGPRLADHADRPVQAGAGLPDRHRGLDPGVGGESGEYQRSAAEPGSGLGGVLAKGPGAADEVGALFDRLRPTLPIVLANLVSVGEVAVTYQPSLEQLLVLLPQAPPSRRPSACTSGTRSRTTRAMRWSST